MSIEPIGRPEDLIKRFQNLPELVRETLLAAFLLAIIIPPFQMALDLYTDSQIERAHSLEFREQILELLKQRPDLARRITAPAQ